MLLVTGFGPFLSVEDNPSAHIAKGCGLPHRVLEVSFKAVDEFFAALDPGGFDGLLMIGVAPKAEKMRIELIARNVVGPVPDVRSEVHGPAPVSFTSSGSLAGTLWRSPELFAETLDWAPSVDAGDYLCNYVYHRALTSFPSKRVGFLHVPPVESMPMDRQQVALGRILEMVSI